ncbi:hypothetical protein GWN15_28985 [candidate division KSB1 bacterium]|nr:hypothetical protein [candidate division KSB1 bacterium]NIU91886.1 hypothetical protein [candidate division KSB1 bacterium]NIW72847.1 hypothetical protein [candidate division KSB1 bacterium]
MKELRIKPSDDENPSQNRNSDNSNRKEDEVSGFIWRTFVGNKKKEDFFKSAILILIVVNGLLGFFLYNQKTQKSIYVIDDGAPKLASLVSSDVRVDEQVLFFVKLWTKLLVEVNGDNYADNRETLKSLSSQDLMKRILSAESASGNRLVKEVIQTETMQLKLADLVIDEIERRGSIIHVKFHEVIRIDVPDGSEKYVTRHNAELIKSSYSLNGLGLVMVDLDNLWKLERRID